MALLSQAQRADRVLERLYRRHATSVYRYAYSVLQNRADAEDVTQTTFMNAFRALERGERPQSPHNWLIAIAHNVCRQRFRQSQRRPNEVALHDDVGEKLVGDDDSPTVEDIRRALSFLPFNQRAALVLRELEGRSYAEIAATLELSVSAVETLIFRARRALREQLDGSLSCADAELAISKQLDGRLPRTEKGALRAHLRECPECATLARRQRGQRSALKALGSVPLPAALSSLFGGGGGTAAGLVAAKAAALVTAAAVVGGGSYEAVHEALPHRRSAAFHAHAAKTAPRKAASARAAAAVAPAVAATPSHRSALVPVRVERRSRGRSFERHDRGRRRGSRSSPVFGTGGEGRSGEDHGGGERRGTPPVVATAVVSGATGRGLGADGARGRLGVHGQGRGHGDGHGDSGSHGADVGHGQVQSRPAGQTQTQTQTQTVGEGQGGGEGHGQGHDGGEQSGASFSGDRHLHLRTCPRPHPGAQPPASFGDAGAGEPNGSPAPPTRHGSDSVGVTKGAGWGSSIDGTQSSAGQC